MPIKLQILRNGAGSAGGAAQAGAAQEAQQAQGAMGSSAGAGGAAQEAHQAQGAQETQQGAQQAQGAQEAREAQQPHGAYEVQQPQAALGSAAGAGGAAGEAARERSRRREHRKRSRRWERKRRSTCNRSRRRERRRRSTGAGSAGGAARERSKRRTRRRRERSSTGSAASAPLHAHQGAEALCDESSICTALHTALRNLGKVDFLLRNLPCLALRFAALPCRPRPALSCVFELCKPHPDLFDFDIEPLGLPLQEVSEFGGSFLLLREDDAEAEGPSENDGPTLQLQAGRLRQEALQGLKGVRNMAM